MVFFHFAPQGGAIHVQSARRMTLIPAIAAKRIDNALFLVPGPSRGTEFILIRMMRRTAFQEPQGKMLLFNRITATDDEGMF
jgi:hypothetical protein